MKFKNKPVEIEAWQYLGHDWRGAGAMPYWLMGAFCKGTVYAQGGDVPYLTIETLEGIRHADVGDWIIQGVKGELYSCKPNIFAATYDKVEED